MDTGFYEVRIGHVELLVYEVPTHLEVLALFLEEKRRGKAVGSSTVVALKTYADSKEIGLAFRDVSNSSFFSRFSWLHRVKSTHMEGGPAYGYNVSGSKLLDIPIQ